MKRIIFFGALASILVLTVLFISGTCVAQDNSVARKAAEAKATVALGAKEWNVDFRSTDPASKVKPWSDTLILADGKLNSKYLAEKGYPVSNIKVTVEDGLIIWETMQGTQKGDIAFWRGELRGDSMSGLLSLKPPVGETNEFYFVSSVVAVPKTEEVKEAAPQKQAEPEKKKADKKGKK
jgi:hypothetical protein